AGAQAASAATTPKSATIVPAATAPPVTMPAAAPIKLDPFFEVRTPARNYGPARLPGGTRVSPLARPLAAHGGIDLGQISPCRPVPLAGFTGRDVRPAAGRARKAAPAAPVAFAAPGADQIKALYRDVPFTEVPLDGMRATIAARLVHAKQTIPHFYLTADVE